MCRMLTPQSPSSTHLINIPVKYNNNDEQQQSTNGNLLIYTNDLAVEDTKKTDGGGALMIVPIPNPTKTEDFGLIDMSTKAMKSFRSDLHEACKALVPQPISLNSSTNSRSRSRSKNKAPLIVHKVGNYSISVAPTLEDLKTRINWKSFTLPDDWEIRLQGLESKEVLPSDTVECADWAYVVAEAQVSVKDDGFGVVFPDPGFVYFPTGHETTANAPASVAFDVCLYNCFRNVDKKEQQQQQQQQYRQDPGGCDSYTLTDKTTIVNIFNQLCDTMKMSDSGDSKSFAVNQGSDVVDYIPIKGYFLNKDIVFSAAAE